jgi:hypothetical protein
MIPSRSAVLAAVAAVALTMNLYAQGERATITGAVTDSTGASIVGAQVNLREVTKNVTLKTTTNAAGIYYLPALPPGQYEIRVEQKGFRATLISGIVLGAGTTATYNARLEVGAVAEAVEVKAEVAQIETQTTALGKVLPTSTINTLPLIGRNPLQLVSLLPGVTPVGGDTNGDATNAKMSGGMARDNAVLTDGGESRGTVNSKTAFTIPMESVAEYRVDTATYGAEFGRAAGAW